MSTLHTVSKPHLLETALRFCRAGDGLLLIEDGVYRFPDRERVAHLALYCLVDDLAARGLCGRHGDLATAITRADFVRLCCEHEKVINWF